MYYKTGVDITNDKQMFEFIKNHFQYPTMNSWNRLYSIANNVKLYNLRLDGDWCTALRFLESDGYEVINWMIREWEANHRGYTLGFNGRSGGYLVMYNEHDYKSILPDYITESEDYEEYKRYCKEYYGSVKDNRYELRDLTILIRDFDKFCDELRDYCNDLSTRSYELEEMERVVEEFNDKYADDLYFLGYSDLECDCDGNVNISQIASLDCMLEAFMRLADRSQYGYLTCRSGDHVFYKEKP
jgi:hypothetical protein